MYIHTQSDGTPIGNFIFGPLAGIFVVWFEEMLVKKGKFKPRIVFWRRMKDDIFFVWKVTKNTTSEDFKTYLNSIEPRIQFTLEMEKNRALNFTDLTIIRQDNRFVM